MTESIVQILLRARDEATSKIRSVSNELGGLGGIAGRLTVGLGPIGAVSAAVAAAGAAAIVTAKNFSDMVITLDRVAYGVKASREEVQILRKVFEDFGLGSEAADNSLQQLGTAIGRQDPLLKRLNITHRDAYGALLQLSDAFAKSTDASSKDEIAKVLLGRSAKDLVGIMDTLSASTDAAGESMRRAGAIISDDLDVRARALHGSLGELGTKWQGVWTNITALLVADAKPIVDAFSWIIDSITKLGDALKALASVPGRLLDLWRTGGVQTGTSTGASPGAPAKTDDSLARALHGETETMQEWIRNALIVSDLRAKILSLSPSGPRGIEPGSGDWSKTFKLMIDEKVPVPQLTRGPLGDYLESLNEAVAKTLDFPTVVHDALQGVWDSLAQTFSTVFANMIDKGQTLASALKSIFRGLVQSILAMLGQLLAAEVFKVLLHLASHALGIPLPSLGGHGSSKSSLQPSAMGLTSAAAAAASGGNNYIVYAIDSRSALMDLTMPGGALRGAFDSLELRNAY